MLSIPLKECLNIHYHDDSSLSVNVFPPSFGPTRASETLLEIQVPPFEYLN